MPENTRRLHFDTVPDDPSRIVTYGPGGYPDTRGYLEYVESDPPKRGVAMGVTYVPDWIRGENSDAEDKHREFAEDNEAAAGHRVESRTSP